MSLEQLQECCRMYLIPGAVSFAEIYLKRKRDNWALDKYYMTVLQALCISYHDFFPLPNIASNLRRSTCTNNFLYFFLSSQFILQLIFKLRYKNSISFIFFNLICQSYSNNLKNMFKLFCQHYL